LLARQLALGSVAAIPRSGRWRGPGGRRRGQLLLGADDGGVGPSAPTMILVSLLGMNAKAAFPIMMGSARS
jgi:hypothetical protein